MLVLIFGTWINISMIAAMADVDNWNNTGRNGCSILYASHANILIDDVECKDVMDKIQNAV